MIIKHENIFYMEDIPKIGGTSTFIREIIKKYKDLDIGICFKTCDNSMLKEIKKYCPAYKLTIGDRINCKICIINYDSSVCDYVESGDIYMVFHADYSCPLYKAYPRFDERIKGYIAITKRIQEVVKEKFGIDAMLCYNPLNIEKKKRLVLVSATRLSIIKGKNRMKELADELDKQGIRYIWYVFTDDRNEISNPNIIYMNPIDRDIEGKPDVLDWVQEADYVVQLSDSEAMSYTIQDSLELGTPVIVTPLPYLDELGIKEGENAYILNFDCSNVSEVVKKMGKIPKFKYKTPSDIYDTMLIESESQYQKDLKEFVEVECTYGNSFQDGFTDVDTGDFRIKGSRWKVNKVRLNELLGNPNHLIKVVK